MSWWLSLPMGAAIGVAFMLLDFVWKPASTVAQLFRISTPRILALAGAGGALIVSLELQALISLWTALMS